MSQSAQRILKRDDALIGTAQCVEAHMGRTLDEGERHRLTHALQNAAVFYNRTDTPGAKMQERLKVMNASTEKLTRDISALLHERGLVSMLSRMEGDRAEWKYTDLQRVHDTLLALEKDLPAMALWMRPRAKRSIKTGRPKNEGNLTVLVFYVGNIWSQLYPNRWDGDGKAYNPVKGKGNEAAFVECVRLFLRYAQSHKQRPAPHTQLAATVRKALKEIQDVTDPDVVI